MITRNEIKNTVKMKQALTDKRRKKYLIVEGKGRSKRHHHASTSSIVKRQVTHGDVTKIELELQKVPNNTENRIPSVLVSSMELDSLADINSTYPDGISETGGVVVRAEEALIVIFVLVLWVAAIALFFNRWGKIRMLEPYQPKFQQQHRQSCAMLDPNPVQHRTCSKFNIHCLDHSMHQNGCVSSGVSRSRQNSVFVGSSTSLLPSQNIPRRTKSAFEIQSVVLAECTVQNRVDEDPVRLSKTLGEFTKPAGTFQRERGMSICHFDRTDVLARPLQRERGKSICHFDRTDVLARPLQRERGMSICHFDRADTGQLKCTAQREKGMSTCNFEKSDSAGPSKSLQRDRGMSTCHYDRQMPSCSKSTEVHNYKATCV